MGSGLSVRALGSMLRHGVCGLFPSFKFWKSTSTVRREGLQERRPFFTRSPAQSSDLLANPHCKVPGPGPGPLSLLSLQSTLPSFSTVRREKIGDPQGC